MTTQSYLFAAFSLVWSALGIASADVNITVINPSFEILPAGGLPNQCGTPSQGCSYSVGSIPGWDGTGVFGQFQPGSFGSFNAYPDGPTSAFSNGDTNSGGTISQTVGTDVEAAGITYTLSVDLGYRQDGASFDASAGLLINGNFIQATGTPILGDWAKYTATYTSTAADIGAPITIELLSSGYEGNFDNVELVATPEPYSGVALAVSLGSLIFVGRMRKARSPR